MKLKYYLRGLGIGIVVTALILQFTSKAPEPMTDAEIKRRAAELGMVEEGSVPLLSDDAQADEKEEAGSPDPEKQVPKSQVSHNSVSKNQASQNKTSKEKVSQNTVQARVSENAVSENQTPEVKKKMPETGTELDEAEDGQAGRTSREDRPDQEESPEDAESGGEDEFVTITIRAGQSSLSAANACRDAGLVENASEFDMFMCSGGYDRRLKAGNHRIKKGATAAEIAKALTTKD